MKKVHVFASRIWKVLYLGICKLFFKIKIVYGDVFKNCYIFYIFKKISLLKVLRVVLNREFSTRGLSEEVFCKISWLFSCLFRIDIFDIVPGVCWSYLSNLRSSSAPIATGTIFTFTFCISSSSFNPWLLSSFSYFFSYHLL